jgi:hypothetical protein
MKDEKKKTSRFTRFEKRRTSTFLFHPTRASSFVFPQLELTSAERTRSASVRRERKAENKKRQRSGESKRKTTQKTRQRLPSTAPFR